jgi:hypothetical protein
MWADRIEEVKSRLFCLLGERCVCHFTEKDMNGYNPILAKEDMFSNMQYIDIDVSNSRACLISTFFEQIILSIDIEQNRD